MNDQLHKIFQKIPDKPMPTNVHRAIVLRVLFLRAERLIFIGAGIISLSFVFSLWHLYMRMIDLDFISVARAVISTVEFNLDSIVDTLRSLSSFTPLGATLVSLSNLGALCFVLYLMRTLKRMEQMGM